CVHIKYAFNAWVCGFVAVVGVLFSNDMIAFDGVLLLNDMIIYVLMDVECVVVLGVINWVKLGLAIYEHGRACRVEVIRIWEGQILGFAAMAG
ncbi:hypothetical protein Tco_1512696, partial [Tanacetum coccineum]